MIEIEQTKVTTVRCVWALKFTANIKAFFLTVITIVSFENENVWSCVSKTEKVFNFYYVVRFNKKKLIMESKFLILVKLKPLVAAI